MKQLPTRVANEIRALRFSRGGMPQAELAERVGVTRQTITAIEKGRYSPSPEVAFRIAHAPDVPLGGVFRYEDAAFRRGAGCAGGEGKVP